MSDEINIFIGWDSREDIAYQVCKHSILSRRKTANVNPLKQSKLRKENLYWREPDLLASTEFTFTRFLVPEIMEFDGWALFMDCDMLLTTDIKELWKQRDPKYAVMCVKHEYTPEEGTKMDGKQQLPYPRKNWSSVMLFNCKHPSNLALTKELVNDPKTTGAYLHRFSWLDDEEIGELEHTWNYLVGWYNNIDLPKIIHYTEGGPWFENYQDCDFADLWLKEKQDYEDYQIYNRKKFRLAPLDGISSEIEELGKELLDVIIDPQGFYHESSIEKFKEKILNMNTSTPSCYCFANSDNPEEKGYDRIAQKFALGARGQLINFENLQTKDINVPVIVRGNAKSKVEAINLCKQRNLTWYNIDTGYLGNGNLKHYHRIAKNNYQNLEEIIDRPSDRLDKIKFRLHEQKEGSSILICPPSSKVMAIYNEDIDTWLENTISELKKYTDRPIVTRVKEQNRKQRVANDPIQNAFDQNVHAVVTYNSIAALESVMYGIPAFTLGPNAAQPLCNTDLSKIENPYFPEEEETLQLLRHLSYCQFTEMEFKNGTAWSIINEGS